MATGACTSAGKQPDVVAPQLVEAPRELLMFGYHDRSRFWEIDHLTSLGHLASKAVETSAAATATVRARCSTVASGVVDTFALYTFAPSAVSQLRGPPVRDVAATCFALCSTAWRARSAAVSATTATTSSLTTCPEQCPQPLVLRQSFVLAASTRPSGRPTRAPTPTTRHAQAAQDRHETGPRPRTHSIEHTRDQRGPTEQLRSASSVPLDQRPEGGRNKLSLELADR